MKEYIRLRVVRTVEEIVEYVPDRTFHGNEASLGKEASLGDIANTVIEAIASGELDLDDLECLEESELEMSVEVEDYGKGAFDFIYSDFYKKLDLEEGFIEDEY